MSFHTLDTPDPFGNARKQNTKDKASSLFHHRPFCPQFYLKECLAHVTGTTAAVVTSAIAASSSSALIVSAIVVALITSAASGCSSTVVISSPAIVACGDIPIGVQIHSIGDITIKLLGLSQSSQGGRSQKVCLLSHGQIFPPKLDDFLLE